MKLKCVNDDNKTIGLNNMMIATNETPHSFITGSSGIIKFNKDGIAYLVI
jgi:hypothetical protein